MISLTDLLKKALGFYSANISKFIGAVFVLAVWNAIASTFSKPPDLPLSYGGIILCITFLLSSFTELTLVGIFLQLFEAKPISLKDAMRSAIKRLPKFLVLLVLFALLMTVGMIFLIVPAIIFGVWFMFLSCCYRIEGLGIRSAFHRSKFLAQGNFFPLFLRISIIVLGVVFVASAAEQGFFTIAGFFTPATMLPRLQVISSMIGSILGTLLLPIITGTIVTLYYEMKKIKRT